MPPSFNHEIAPPAPDRFYLNEMKREVTNLSQINETAEMTHAATIIDMHSLEELVVAGCQVSPQATMQLMDSHKILRNQMWKYISERFVTAQARLGYAPEDLRGQMVAISSACVSLSVITDIVKRRQMGADASTAFNNALTSSLFRDAAKAIVVKNKDAIDPSLPIFSAKFTHEAFEKTAVERGKKSWSWAKTHIVGEALTGYLSLFDILSKFPDLGSADTTMLQRQNNELAQASTTLRTYTPKPAIGIWHATDVQTLFVDQEVHSHFMVTRPGALTTPVKLFAGVELDSSNVAVEYKRTHGKEGGHTKRIAIQGIDQRSTPHCEIVIFDNEILTIMGGYVDDFAEGIDAVSQAVMLQAMLLGQNFDLTVPSYIVALADEDAERQPHQTGSNPIADKLRRLLVARTRVLNTLGNDIHEELIKEEDENNRQHRDIIKHGVVGHLRRLPEGYHPTPEARRLCLEQLGVNLPAGHTYVQKHNRGNIDLPARGHKMVKNPKAAGRISVGGAFR